MQRLMGLDFGSSTIGVALSDPGHIIASPYEVIYRDRENALRRSLRRITDIAREQDVGTIVLGLPLNMDDSAGERAEKTLEFRDELSRRLTEAGLDIRIEMQDERLSTRAADEVLIEAGRPLSERKENVDKIAAAIILRDYMEGKQNGRR